MPSGRYSCEFGSVDLFCGDCVAGSQINQPVLCYPQVARAARITGVVQMKMVVDKRGNVIWTRILNNVHYLLKAAATQEALQRKYKPFVCHGHAVKAVVYQNYKFE
ncbi:MAG TPA: energy transducer TonB [Pyrinomonadaceae bacterium]|nr:energy transducer TonB [Pyrinomonadaceae bacterium]